MERDPDDDALNWAGETDPTHVEAPEPAPTAPRDGQAAPDRSSSALLVGYGVLGGIYLLYTIGWIVASVRNPIPVNGVFAVIMYQFGEFMAIVAPLLWASAVFVLTRQSRTVVRVLLLVLGVVLLVPWPFVIGG